MSVVERIRQIQAENERRAAEAESAKVARAEAENHEEEAQLNNIRLQNEEIFKETGVIEILQQIDREFLVVPTKTNFWGKQIASQFEHGVFSSFEAGSVMLAWRYDLGQIHKGGLSGYNYNSILVNINRDTGTLTIVSDSTREIQKDQWQQNKDLIESALAQAYLEPKRHIDTSWSIN